MGISLFAQNHGAWERFEALERGDDGSALPNPSDVQVYRDELRLGEQIEPLGFDSIWSVEHHFTPYTMVTNALQFLSFWAGRTSRVGLGTMVAVMPWHHPVRLAEDLVMLQHLLGERELTVGFGRGAGRREFGGLGVPMGESRGRFLEALDIVRLALTEERFAFEGDYYNVPDVAQREESPHISLRPRPRDAQRLLEAFYCAWGTPQTAPIAAQAGLKPLIIPQKHFEDYHDEIAEFNRLRADAGYSPANPVLVAWLYCTETEAAAAEGATRHLSEYAESALRHYELFGDHFSRVKGYEFYAGVSQDNNGREAGGRSALAQAYLKDNIWGTPAQCIERLHRANESIRPSQIVLVPRYGSMPVEVAEKSMQLFAKEVLPAAQEMATQPTQFAATG